ncbi:hypothetical protein I4U23_026911 [Adineta vaga]|nr:hypothetical protein I4U23_026911 [Adineta vaga]
MRNMSTQLNSYTFLILSLFIFTSVNGFAVTCQYYQKTCSQYSYTWCCESYQYCGSYTGSCLYYTTQTPTTPAPSSDYFTTVLVVCIIIPVFVCIIGLSCYVHAQKEQRAHSSSINTNSVRPHPSRQQSSHRPLGSFSVRSVYNASEAPPISSIYEEAPPSYEFAIANIPPKTPPIVSPPMTANVV